MAKIIVFASPVFLLLIALELAWSRHPASRTAGQAPYRLSDALASLSLGILSQLVAGVAKALSIGIYAAVFAALAGSTLATPPDFWSSPVGWLLAFVLYDLCYYWQHRAGHRVALFWAAHVVHHQSQHYNLTTALRQSGTGVLLGWVFYLPMALVGVPPLVFAGVAVVNLLYQFWVHTEQIGSLGWFDRWFCSPSNHRVHHAINDEYLDKNYGGVLMAWDHVFGTFEPERATCVYGTRTPLNSCDPLWANLQVYAALARESWRTPRWGDKLGLWFHHAGWQSAEMARQNPKPAFALQEVQTYAPPLSGGHAWAAVTQFVLLLGGGVWYGMQAPLWPWAHTAMLCAALMVGLWTLGRYVQGSFSLWHVLMLDAAALATLSGSDLVGGYLLFKPLVMLLAMGLVLARSRAAGAGLRGQMLLLSALVGSLAGDVFLMLPGNHFIAGLASFLVAHLFYIGLFVQGQRWLPRPKAALLVGTVAVAMYATLWAGLGDTVLKVAVAVYVLVIALMASQAMGRAAVLGTKAARRVALGAAIFMVSDATLAINKFVAPVPFAPFWILLTYYAAQALIVFHALESDSTPRAA